MKATFKIQFRNDLPISVASLDVFSWFYCRSNYINYISTHRINIKDTLSQAGQVQRTIKKLTGHVTNIIRHQSITVTNSNRSK